MMSRTLLVAESRIKASSMAGSMQMTHSAASCKRAMVFFQSWKLPLLMTSEDSEGGVWRRAANSSVWSVAMGNWRRLMTRERSWLSLRETQYFFSRMGNFNSAPVTSKGAISLKAHEVLLVSSKPYKRAMSTSRRCDRTRSSISRLLRTS